MAPEVQPTPAGQDPATPTGQDPQGAATPPGQDPATPATGQDPAASTTLSPEAKDAELTRARQEAASWRTKAQALEAADADRKKAEMTEVDRLKAEAAEAKTASDGAAKQLRNERAARVIERKAGAMSFIDTEDALKGIDIDALKFADDGSVEEAAVDEALKALASRKPHWIKGAQTSTTSPTNGAKPGAVLTREAIKGMTDQQVSDLMADPETEKQVMAALAAP